MKTAIIGLGNIGRQVAQNLLDSGQKVIVADHGRSRAQDFASASGGKAQALADADAVEQADVIVMAISFDAIKEFLAEYGSKLRGKILVDPSNAVAPDGNGGFRKTVAPEQSAGEVIAALLPPGVRLVKAFGTLTAASLRSGARRTPEPNVLFYASDDRQAGDVVRDLIKASGFEALRVGGMDQAIRIEAFGDLHEVGKLGRLVTAKEAAAVV
jgi:8-hydroxy-5-deazaflavin:NADPH oxidoreductase